MFCPLELAWGSVKKKKKKGTSSGGVMKSTLGYHVCLPSFFLKLPGRLLATNALKKKICHVYLIC